jgi:hypothetical protein
MKKIFLLLLTLNTLQGMLLFKFKVFLFLNFITKTINKLSI